MFCLSDTFVSVCMLLLVGLHVICWNAFDCCTAFLHYFASVFVSDLCLHDFPNCFYSRAWASYLHTIMFTQLVLWKLAYVKPFHTICFFINFIFVKSFKVIRKLSEFSLLFMLMQNLQSVLNAAAMRLVARLPWFSYIWTFMAEQLHWLPLSDRIQFNVFVSVLKAQLRLAISVISFFLPSLPLPFVLFDPLIGLTTLFPASGPPWLNRDTLHP